MTTNKISFTTNIGVVTLESDGEALVSCDIYEPSHKLYPTKSQEARSCIDHTGVLKEAREQLLEYLDGKRTDFNIKCLPSRGTEFERAAWDKLRSIPYGKTISYSELASGIGRPKSFRAVGRANGRNPLPIFIPCHRVIGKSGNLTGFSCGIEVKKQLLRLEQSNLGGQI